MATCKYCGAKAGYSGVCGPCTSRAMAEVEQVSVEIDTKEREMAVSYALERLEAGKPVHLHVSVRVGAESLVEGSRHSESDFSEVRQLGLQGWELVGLVPRTNSISLRNQNVIGQQSWGGGLGGNVIGAHAVLKKTYSSVPEDQAELSDDIQLVLSSE